MDAAWLGAEKLEVFILVLVRSAGIFTMTPIFGANQVPPQVRIAVAVGMALIFMPMCPSSGIPATDVLQMGLLVAKEALVGVVIGFVVTLVFAVFQIAGDFIDMQAGFSFATMVDPVNGSNTSVAARFHQILIGLLFFATNAHHVLISGLADSFRLVPVGAMSLNPLVANGVLDIFTTLFTVALRIASPVLAAVFLADVALAIMCRAVPQMNVIIAGMPLKLGVGLVGLLVAIPVLVTSSEGIFSDMNSQMGNVLHLLVANQVR